MAACCRTVPNSLLALAACGAIVFLAGVAATTSAGNRGDIPLIDRITFFTNAGIPAHVSTAWTMGWSWLIVFLNISTVALAAVALFRMPAMAIGAAALLTLCTSFLMPLCNAYLQLHYTLSGTEYDMTRHAVNCTFAGTLIASCANMLLCLCLGYHHSPGGAPTCCRKAKAQEEVKPAPANVTATDANSQAFIRKTEQAAAANMV